MQKIFNKALLHILVLALIGATVLMLSPLAVVINQEEGFALSSGDVIPVITASEIVDFLSGLLPRASHEEFAFCLQKIIATHTVVVNACAIVANEIKLFAEWQHYALANDLHFNSPLLTYRQPSSENSPAGGFLSPALQKFFHCKS